MTAVESRRGWTKTLADRHPAEVACTLRNPWPGRRLDLSRHGGRPERRSSVTFRTSPGERIPVKPE